MQITGLGMNLGNGLELRRFTITHDDLTDTDTSQAITLFTMKKGSAIMGVRIKHSVAFSGGGVTALTVAVGSSVVGAGGFATAFDIFQAVAATTLQMTQQFKAGTYADEVVQATFTSTTDNLDQLDTGSVDIDILFMNVTTPGL